MKVLTIKQPFASLIMAGIKTVETRAQDTKIRGRIFIHAGKNFADELPVFDSDGYGAWPYIVDMLKVHGARYYHELGKKYAELPRGVILGSVELVTSTPAEAWLKAMEERPDDLEREEMLGDLGPSRYAYTLKNPQYLSSFVQARGNLGFWNYYPY